jgi:hypothetical protein
MSANIISNAATPAIITIKNKFPMRTQWDQAHMVAGF